MEIARWAIDPGVSAMDATEQRPAAPSAFTRVQRTARSLERDRALDGSMPEPKQEPRSGILRELAESMGHWN
jgi:hypothetical protein